MANKLIYPIPLTTSTGKARVKRRVNNFGEPLSAEDNTFKNEDYIEWQISYFIALDTVWDLYRKQKDKKGLADELFSYFKNKELVDEIKGYFEDSKSLQKMHFKSGLKSIFEKYSEVVLVKEHKGGKEYVMYELADLFKQALEESILNKKDVEELLKFNSRDKIDIEANYKVNRKDLNKTISEGFKCYEEDYPLFIKDINGVSFTEVQLKHKQRAVGFQSMIYFCVWLRNIKDSEGKSVIGRKAKRKEIIKLELSKEELFAIAKSFIIASADHDWDMKTILKGLIK